MTNKKKLTDKLELKVVTSITYGGKDFPEINLTVMGNGIKQTPVNISMSLEQAKAISGALFSACSTIESGSLGLHTAPVMLQ
jgi:hypothetical protein